MKRTYVDYLEDILDSMQEAQRFVEGMSYSRSSQEAVTSVPDITRNPGHEPQIPNPAL